MLCDQPSLDECHHGKAATAIVLIGGTPASTAVVEDVMPRSHVFREKRTRNASARKAQTTSFVRSSNSAVRLLAKLQARQSQIAKPIKICRRSRTELRHAPSHNFHSAASTNPNVGTVTEQTCRPLITRTATV